MIELSVRTRAGLFEPLTDILPKGLKDEMVRVGILHEGLEGIRVPVLVTKQAPNGVTSMSDTCR